MRTGRHPWNALLFIAFTVAEAVSVGVLCGRMHDAPAVVAGVGAGTLLFVTLSCATCSLGRPLRMSEGLPLGLLLVAGVLMVVQVLVGTTVLSTVVLGLGVVAFSAFVMHDTSQLLHVAGPDDAFDAAMNLYLDAINLVVCCIQVFQGGVPP